MVGILQAWDPATNLVRNDSRHRKPHAPSSSPKNNHLTTQLSPGKQVLKETVERVIFPADDERESYLQPHGIYLIRGELVVLVGQVDDELDASIDWTKVQGNAIGSTKHTS